MAFCCRAGYISPNAMATGAAPSARTDSCQIGAGGVRTRWPFRSSGLRTGLLVKKWR
jgi:hypothetical protein